MAARPLRDDGDRCQMCCFYGIVALVFLVFGYCTYQIATLPPPPRYSVAVAAVSGLDPATDLRGAPHALDPAFNLTLRIDATLSAKHEAPYCLDRGTSVKVSYLRVPIAVGRAPEPGEGTCAAAGQRRDLAVVARGRAVVVPGFMLDSLAEDLRRGEAVFEITLMSPSVGAGHWEQMTCWGMVGNDASLEAPCVYSSVDVPPPCPGTPGRPGCVPRPRKVLPDDDVPADDDGSPAPMHAAAGTPAEHKSWSIVSQ